MVSVLAEPQVKQWSLNARGEGQSGEGVKCTVQQYPQMSDLSFTKEIRDVLSYKWKKQTQLF